MDICNVNLLTSKLKLLQEDNCRRYTARNGPLSYIYIHTYIYIYTHTETHTHTLRTYIEDTHTHTHTHTQNMHKR